MKIPKRVREEAALICNARANDWAHDNPCDMPMCTYSDNDDAIALATTAFWCTPVEPYWDVDQYITRWAEAEALLRTGWSPS